MAKRQTFGGPRVWIATTFVIILAVVCVWQIGGRRQNRRIPEIAVLTPTSNTTIWTRTVGALELATARLGLTAHAQGDAVEVRRTDGSPLVVFRRHRDVGLLEIAHRVELLTHDSDPPIAVFGGSNSTGARVIAEALQAQVAGQAKPPVFLLTSGTVDELTSIYAGRTFRFGHPNSRQVHEVVLELKRHYEDRGVAPPIFEAALVSFDDDGFSKDVVKRMRTEFDRAFGDKRVNFHDVPLPTATGSHDDPSPREKEICKKLALEMVQSPSQPWIVVLPTGADALRRLSIAVHDALREYGPDVARLAYDNLTVLAADSLSFADFMGRLSTNDVRVQAIFFTQSDPRAPGASEPDSERMALSIYYDAVHTALAVALQTTGSLDAESYRQALVAYREAGAADTYFDGPERRAGGGAVRVSPNAMTERFDFELASDRTAATASKQ